MDKPQELVCVQGKVFEIISNHPGYIEWQRSFVANTQNGIKKCRDRSVMIDRYLMDPQNEECTEGWILKRDENQAELEYYESILEKETKSLERLENELKVAQDEWNIGKKMKLFNEDGTCTVDWIYLENVFDLLWEPGNVEQMDAAERFNRTCKCFRETVHEYLKGEKYYYPFVSPTSTESVYEVESMHEIEIYCNLANVYRITCTEYVDWKPTGGFLKVHYRFDKWYIDIHLIKTLDDTSKFAMIMCLGNSPDQMWLVGGKYTRNENGRVCDWKYAPITRMEPAIWNGRDVQCKQATIRCARPSRPYKHYRSSDVWTVKFEDEDEETDDDEEHIFNAVVDLSVPQLILTRIDTGLNVKKRL